MIKNLKTDIDCEDKVDLSDCRVAIVHPSAGVNWSGGSESFAIELARHLSSYMDVELLGGNEQVPCYHPAGGLNRTQVMELMIRFPFLSQFLRQFSNHPEIWVEHGTNFIPCLTRLLTKPADLIFPCNSYGGLAMAAAVRALSGTPVLYKAHTGLLLGGKILERELKFRPDHLVVVSQEMKDRARQIRPEQSISILSCGVDTEKFRPSGNRIPLDLSGPVVLCVASLNRTDHKRVELAIRAVSQLPDASLLVCGDGSDRDYFQALGDKMLGPSRFKIQTFTFYQMPDVYRSVDLFTLPSENEPFGIAFIEAMGCGLPVVATDDQLRRYIVGDAGILCDVTDIDQYAKALQTALSRDWQSKPLERAKQFSWDSVARRYVSLMKTIIDQSNKK